MRIAKERNVSQGATLYSNGSQLPTGTGNEYDITLRQAHTNIILLFSLNRNKYRCNAGQGLKKSKNSMNHYSILNASSASGCFHKSLEQSLFRKQNALFLTTYKLSLHAGITSSPVCRRSRIEGSISRLRIVFI